ncbi:transient receptor potential cation channel subfamily A member 1 homolog isoform X1 [Penaeus indicus]|uniref:transient receptor potential cation channel subfamily A member 1 homolog isoform X1 n=2 Tax=Penaeus indicus TaxID=29960 RepID=UPI00300C3E18
MDDSGASEPMLNTSDEVAVVIEESQQDGDDTESDALPLEIFREQQGARASRLTSSPGRYTNNVKTNMHQAAEVGDVNRLIQLIQERPDHLSQQDENGHVPLHLAARGLHLNCCQALLSAGPREVNVKDKLGNTPLLLAVTTGDVSFKIAELLVLNGASVKTANRAKRTALHLAAEKGNDKILTLLVDNCLESVHAKETEQQTPLHLAARSGHVASCQLLVGKGADKEAKDTRGYTALHWAAKMGFSECCSQLLKLGSKVNCSDKAGNTPLHLICSSSKEKPGCVEVLFNYGASPAIQNSKGETPFHCAQYSPGEVRKLFETHPDIDLFITDNKGKTVLHCAAERKKSRNVEFILAMAKSQNINMKHFVNMPDIGGKTALYVAIEGGDLECCKSLVKAGADGNLVLGARGTSLHLAAEEGLREVCEYLITKGIKTDTRNNSLMTPLHLAAKNGHANCCEVLLKRGVPWAAQDDQGMTALHHAAKEEQAECCRVIVALQPSAVTRTDKAGQTPLHYAVEKNCLECCQALVTPRSDVWCQSNGKSPIKYAYEKRFHQIFDFLLNTENVERKKRTERDIDFRDLLEESLEHISSSSEDNIAHRHIARAIIHSCFWEESLKSHGTPGDLTPPEKQKNGNLRLLVKHLPDVAKVALDKCMATDGSVEGAHQYIVRYLDQEYFIGVNPKKAKGTYIPSCSGEQLSKGVRVGGVSRVWREDHVVALMTRHGRHGLLQHPLVTRWLDYKWQSYVSYGLYARIVLASVLALLLTVFTAISWDWSYLKQEYNYTQEMVCVFGKEKIVGPEVEELLRQRGRSPLVLSYVIVALIAVWAVHDFYSFVMLREKYFTKENVAFLACAIASVVFVMNFSHCSQMTYVREDAQWVAGLIAIFLAWLHVFLLTRRLPFCTPLLFRLKLLIHMALKVAVPVVAVGSGVVAANWITSKGDLAYNQNWSWISKVVSHPTVSVSFLVVVTVIVCIVLMDEGRKKEMERYKKRRRVAFVEMILNFDLLYPCLRRRFYVTWIPQKPPVRRDASCGRASGCCAAGDPPDDDAAEAASPEVAPGKTEALEAKLDALRGAVEKQALEVAALLKQLNNSVEKLGQQSELRRGRADKED